VARRVVGQLRRITGWTDDASRYVTGQLFHVDGGWTAAGRFLDSYVEAAASRREGGR